MSSGRRRRSAIELGHDSFLDIVANLVGILIILVVILGAQSTAVIEEMKEQVDQVVETDRASEDQLATLAQYAMRAASAQADSDRFERLLKQYDSDLDRRKRQRAMLMDLLSEAQLAWDDQKQKLDEKTRLAAAAQTELEIAQSELAKLEGERERLQNQEEPIVAVAHLPTPMAKTVFGDEIHLRLKGNLLSVVPVERLIDEIKRDFERAARARDGQLDGAVGPVRGYVARYLIDKSSGLVARGGQAQMTTRVQLVGMSLEPLAEPHGQAIEKVLTGRSELDVELAGRDPGSTSITVWVYPDSFAAFRDLKEQLYRKGFATAARPLTMDRQITASPQGTRSRAQ